MTKKNYIAISIISLFLLSSCVPVLISKLGSHKSQDKNISNDSSAEPYKGESKEE